MKNQQKLQWMVMAVFCCLMLAILAANLPAMMKKLGLFSFLLGAISGYLLTKLPGFSDFKNRRLIVGGIILLGGLTEAGRLAETYRQFQNYRQQQLQRELDRTEGLAALLADQITITNDSDWQIFLRQHFASLPNLPDDLETGWLNLLAGMEVLLAMLGAAVVCYWRQPIPVMNDGNE